MNVLKSVFHKGLAKLDYELLPSSATQVRFDNFVNLVQLYEQYLNKEDNLISPDELRPKLLARLRGTPPSEAYFIIQALSKSKQIPGDVCEFGVAQGETSALIANEIARGTQKVLHLFDSFEGLPKPTEKDKLKDDIFSLGSMEAYTGKMSCREDMVKSRLKAISFPERRFQIHKGFIEQLINEDQKLPKKVSFAYVDFDLYEPIKVALNFLHSVTPAGAIIIVDDYDFFSTGVKAVVDEFVAEQNVGKTAYHCLVPDTRFGYFAVLTKES